MSLLLHIQNFENRFISYISGQTDRVDPILVKEVRKMLKSNIFILGFMLLLVMVWLITTFLILSMQITIERTEVGREFFSWYYRMMMTPVCLFIPLMVYQSIQEEFSDNTFDMLFITPLKPQMIVRGKLFAGLVQSLVYFSSMTPFMCFSYMLQGISFLTIIFYLAIGCLVIITLSLWAILMSSIAGKNPYINLVTLFMTLFGCVFVWGIMMAIMDDRSIVDVTLSNLVFFAGGIICVSYFFLIFIAVSVGIAIDRLQPYNPHAVFIYDPQDLAEIKREFKKRAQDKKQAELNKQQTSDNPPPELPDNPPLQPESS